VLAASLPLARAASTVKFSWRSDIQSSRRSVTARATLLPRLSARDVKLLDADVVSNTASRTINGSDTNNIATTSRYR